jgi:hypothetical protein
LKKPKQDTSTTNSSSKVHKKICNSNKVLTWTYECKNKSIKWINKFFFLCINVN